jgi:hypothetical protein
MRIIDLQWRETAHGYESEAVFEMTRSDGSKSLRREFWHHVDLGNSYVTVRHASRDSAPSETSLVIGKKGEVEGQYRNDHTEMLILQPDGNVRRTEQTVKTWLKADAMWDKVAAWYRDGTAAGMTPDQIYRLIWNLESGRDERQP